MISLPRRHVGRAFCAASCFACFIFAPRATIVSQGQSPPAAAQDSGKQTRESGPPQLIPGQQAQTTAAFDGLVRDASNTNSILPVPGAVLTLRNIQSGQSTQSGQVFSTTSSGEGVFRIFPLPPGHYELRVEAKGFAPFVLSDLALQPNEIMTLEVSLVTIAAMEARSRLPRL